MSGTFFTKNSPNGSNHQGREALFDFLLQGVKLSSAKEFAQSNFQAIA